MRYIFSFVLFSVLMITLNSTADAQETTENVVDEVVAQVNDGVITLSRIKREIKSIIDMTVQEGKSREEAQKMVDEKQGELIANLINEELLIQRAKEIGLEREIDGMVNERFVQMMKQYNMKSIDMLHQEMEKAGINPQEYREQMRKQATKEMVLQREVQNREYWKPQGKELRAYYEKNKTRFTKPATISISEIFLNFAGRDEDAVRAKAKELVEQLRKGADFEKMVAESSDRAETVQNKGKAGTHNVNELDAKFAKALENVKVGGYTDPIEIDQIGINILRVDELTKASSESHFDENAVRMAIMQERIPEAQKDFMSSLRKESYIKINDSYRPMVAPLLFADERKEKTPEKK